LAAASSSSSIDRASIRSSVSAKIRNVAPTFSPSGVPIGMRWIRVVSLWLVGCVTHPYNKNAAAKIAAATKTCTRTVRRRRAGTAQQLAVDAITTGVPPSFS
jgi:hypothetical protein